MIGVFDSGSGGLTVLHAIREVLPSVNVVYFGDIANAPYGEKTGGELSVMTVHAIQLLQNHGARSIVSACNSVSASLTVSLFDVFDLEPTQLIEMVGPTVSYFRNSNARILLCATPATIRSGIYQNAFQMIGKEVEFVAVPKLAGAIEFGASDEELLAIIVNAFYDVQLDAFDVLILGCTHYPLVAHIFVQSIPVTLALFDPALVVAERVEKHCWPHEVNDGTTTFLLSKDSLKFRELVERLFPHSTYTVEVVE